MFSNVTVQQKIDSLLVRVSIELIRFFEHKLGIIAEIYRNTTNKIVSIGE